MTHDGSEDFGADWRTEWATVCRLTAGCKRGIGEREAVMNPNRENLSAFCLWCQTARLVERLL